MNKETKMRNRLEMFGGGTVDDLNDWVLRRGLDPAIVMVTSCHLRFDTPETPEEVELRLKHEERNRLRTEEWERATLARLTAKYGPVETTEAKGDPARLRAISTRLRRELLRVPVPPPERGMGATIADITE